MLERLAVLCGLVSLITTHLAFHLKAGRRPVELPFPFYLGGVAYLLAGDFCVDCTKTPGYRCDSPGTA